MHWARASPISPTSTPPANRSPPKAAPTCSSSPTASGIPTVRSRRSQRRGRSCRAAPSPPGAVTPSSPTCARPTMHWTSGPKLRSKTWSRTIRIFIRQERSASRICRTRNARRTGRSDSGSCAAIRTPAANPCFLSAHAGFIEGLSIPESRMLLMDLTEFATQERFVYSHRWRRHDLVIWDNQATMHRGRLHDPAEARDIRQTRLAGPAETISQIA